MSNVLYRKYRPSKFSEVIGQEQIVASLADQVKNESFAHAYLFAGSRGTGKTSVARILATELGCTDKDLYEIDAASNTGVDNIRDLREGVATLPFESPVKVYLIDEVHMLSKGAFNALLKTLEEPPAHVVFILATTELHKVPDTIISRCQLHIFRRPTSDDLVETIKRVSKKEGVKIDIEASKLIAFLGDGSFRDTLGVLQKVLAGASGDIDALKAESITGAPAITLIHNFLTSLVSGQVEPALLVLKQIVIDNREIKIFTKLALDELRLAMLLKYAPEMKTEIENIVGKDRYLWFGDFITLPHSNKLSAVLKELLEAYDSVGGSHWPSLSLELASVNICNKLNASA